MKTYKVSMNGKQEIIEADSTGLTLAQGQFGSPISIEFIRADAIVACIPWGRFNGYIVAGNE